MVTDAQKKYSKKYIKEKCDEITVRPRKGTKERWKKKAEEQGLSLQRFVIETVNKRCKE